MLWQINMNLNISDIWLLQKLLAVKPIGIVNDSLYLIIDKW